MSVHPSSTITIHRAPSSAGGDSDDDDLSTLSGSEAEAEEIKKTSTSASIISISSSTPRSRDRRLRRSRSRSSHKNTSAATNNNNSNHNTSHNTHTRGTGSRLQSYLGGTKKFINANSAHQIRRHKPALTLATPKTKKNAQEQKHPLLQQSKQQQQSQIGPYRFQMGTIYTDEIHQDTGRGRDRDGGEASVGSNSNSSSNNDTTSTKKKNLKKTLVKNQSPAQFDKWVVQGDGSVEVEHAGNESEMAHEERNGSVIGSVSSSVSGNADVRAPRSRTSRTSRSRSRSRCTADGNHEEEDNDIVSKASNTSSAVISHASSRLSRLTSPTSARKTRLERLQRRRSRIMSMGKDDSMSGSTSIGPGGSNTASHAGDSLPPSPYKRKIKTLKFGNVQSSSTSIADAASTATGESGGNKSFFSHYTGDVSCRSLQQLDDVVKATEKKFELSKVKIADADETTTTRTTTTTTKPHDSPKISEKTKAEMDFESTAAPSTSTSSSAHQNPLLPPPPPPLSSRKAVYMKSLHKDENRQKKKRPKPSRLLQPNIPSVPLFETSIASPPKVTRKYSSNVHHRTDANHNHHHRNFHQNQIMEDGSSHLHRRGHKSSHTNTISTFSPINDSDETKFNSTAHVPSSNIINDIEKPMDMESVTLQSLTETSLVTPKPIRPKYLHRSFWSVPATAAMASCTGSTSVSTSDCYPSPAATANTRSTAASTIIPNSPSAPVQSHTDTDTDTHAHKFSKELEDIRVKILGQGASRGATPCSPPLELSPCRSKSSHQSHGHGHGHSPKKEQASEKSPVKRVDDIYQSMVKKFNCASCSPTKGDSGMKKTIDTHYLAKDISGGGDGGDGGGNSSLSTPCQPVGGGNSNHSTPCQLAALEPPKLKRVICDDEASTTVSSNASWSSFISDEQEQEQEQEQDDLQQDHLQDDMSSKGSAFQSFRKQEKKSTSLLVPRMAKKSLGATTTTTITTITKETTFPCLPSPPSPPSKIKRHTRIGAERERYQANKEHLHAAHSHDGSGSTSASTITNSTQKSTTSNSGDKQSTCKASVAEIDIDMSGRSAQHKPEVYDIFSEIERDLRKAGMNVKINVINKDQSDSEAMRTSSSTALGSIITTPTRIASSEVKLLPPSASKNTRRGHVKHSSLSALDYSGWMSHRRDDSSLFSEEYSNCDDGLSHGSRHQKRTWMTRRRMPPKVSSNPNILSDNTPVLLSKIRFATKKVLRRSKEEQDHLLHDKTKRSESDKPNLAEEQGELMWFQS